MPFVQPLTVGTYPGEITLNDLHMNIGGPKTVSLGNILVVFIARCSFGLGSAAGGLVNDNLGHGYTVYYNDTGNPRLDTAICVATVTNPGSLTDIIVHPSGIGSVSYHISGVAAEFTGPAAVGSLGAEELNSAPGAAISSVPLTIGNSLLFHACAIGGTANNPSETGDSGAYTPPAGFTLANGILSTAWAPSCYLSYKYGSLTAQVLTGTWVNNRYAHAIHGVGATFVPEFIPQIYRVKRP